MLRKMKKIIVGFAALAFGVIVANFTAIPAQAEQAITRISVTPTKLTVELAPGQQQTGEYTVINDGNRAANLKVYPTSYKIDDQNGRYEAIYETDWSRALLAKWISYDETEFSLQPGEKKVVKFRISVPENVPAGGQYAMLMTEIQPSKTAEKNATILTKKRIGLNIFSHVAGETKIAGEIKNLSAAFWQNGAPLTASVEAKNSGNIDFSVNSQIKVKNIFGKEIFKSETKNHDIYPETTRKIDLNWDKAKWGIYRLEIHADMIFANKTETKISQKIVVVFPIWLAILIVIFAAAILISFAKKKKSSSLKIVKKKGKFRS